MKTKSVWIVQQDDTPHNTVLGVFGSLSDADNFVEEVKSHFPGGVVYSEYPLGYRYDGGASRYSGLS